MKKILVAAMLVLNSPVYAALSVVAVDVNNTINAFSPGVAFAINTGEWQGYDLLRSNVWQFQHAGFRYIRFPGGSNSNEYHWNGNGAYDSNGIWTTAGSPAPDTFSPGFLNLSRHRGSSSVGYGKKAVVTDGDSGTFWRSYPGETAPQHIILDLGYADYNPRTVSRLVIEWGAAHPGNYKIQYSNAGWISPGIWAYNDTAWTDVSAGYLTGTAGTADIPFTAVSARYLRVLCLSYSGSNDVYEIKEIRAYNGAALMTSNTPDVKQQTFTISSTMSLGADFERFGNMDFEQFMSICRSLTPAAEPVITVNFFTGTTQEAADWVYYANIHRGYNIKYWEIGNENYGTWESGGPASSDFYARRYIEFYDAMKAVDPSITIMPQFNTILDRENVTFPANTGGNYLENFLKNLQAAGRADIIRDISIHKYPTYQPVSEAVPLANVDVWDTELQQLNTMIDNYCGGAGRTKIWLTEYNDGIDSKYTNGYSNVLFISSFMLNYMKNGGDYGFYFADFGTPGPGQFDPAIFSDFGAIEGGGLSGAYSSFRYQPRSAYWALWLLNNRFSAADTLGNTLVHTASSLPALKAYANKRGDRKLSIILVNTDKANSHNAAVSISGFSPAASADITTFSPQHYSWIEMGSLSHANPNLQPQDSVYNQASQNFTFTVPAYNIKVITMYDSSLPAFTPSSTPTRQPTPTITPTPVIAGGVMLDDCEDGNAVNLWNGRWSVYGDGISVYPANITAMECPGSFDGSCYMKVTGTVIGDNYGFGVNSPLSSNWSAINMSQYDGIFFWYKGDGYNTSRVYLNQRDAPNYNFYGVDFVPNTYWVFHTIPFASMTQADWAAEFQWDVTKLQAVSFQTGHGAHQGYIGVDNIGFYRNTPTPAPTVIVLPQTLSDVRALPSLCTVQEGCGGITFTGLTAKTKISIYTLGGNLVHSADADTPAGTYFWKITGLKKGKAPAPGIYIYVIQAEDGNTVKGKAAVVR